MGDDVTELVRMVGVPEYRSAPAADGCRSSVRHPRSVNDVHRGLHSSADTSDSEGVLVIDQVQINDYHIDVLIGPEAFFGFCTVCGEHLVAINCQTGRCNVTGESSLRVKENGFRACHLRLAEVGERRNVHVNCDASVKG